MGVVTSARSRRVGCSLSPPSSVRPVPGPGGNGAAELAVTPILVRCRRCLQGRQGSRVALPAGRRPAPVTGFSQTRRGAAGPFYSGMQGRYDADLPALAAPLRPHRAGVTPVTDYGPVCRTWLQHRPGVRVVAWRLQDPRCVGPAWWTPRLFSKDGISRREVWSEETDCVPRGIPVVPARRWQRVCCRRAWPLRSPGPVLHPASGQPRMPAPCAGRTRN